MIDKRMLHDSLTIKKSIEEDDWGKEAYSEPLLLSPCKFDRSFSRSGTGNHRSEYNTSTVIVYHKYCPVSLDKSFVGGIVEEDGVSYVVKDIIPQYHPLTSRLLAYEIEVI